MARSSPRPDATVRLATRLRQIARQEAQHAGTHISRFRVRQDSPLIIEELEGELVLEEGDPDFTIGDLMRHFIAQNGLEEDDQVLVAHAGGEWHAVDVVTDRTAWEP